MLECTSSVANNKSWKEGQTCYRSDKYHISHLFPLWAVMYFLDLWCHNMSVKGSKWKIWYESDWPFMDEECLGRLSIGSNLIFTLLTIHNWKNESNSSIHIFPQGKQFLLFYFCCKLEGLGINNSLTLTN